MSDFMLDGSDRTEADDLLDQLLVSAHAELVDAIESEQLRVEVLRTKLTADSQQDNQCQVYGMNDGEGTLKVVGAFGYAVDRVARLKEALKESCAARLGPVPEMALALVTRMEEDLSKRSLSRVVAEEIFKLLKALVPEQPDWHEVGEGSVRVLLAQAHEAVAYLFDSSDDFEGCPVS